ncbi:hypothetical protein F5Y13DRAFT_202982 [Hypoxylon sp. FL1857]|nr:hypothetical protein F5Y13DRAFT_202982 [Hypoxylon sp. FL1857]
MVKSKVLFQIACLYGGTFASSRPREHTRQLSSNDGLGSFVNPAVVVRPRYRYWLPDASVEPKYVAEDIAELGARGAGGIQFLNYYNYGGSSGSAATDWNIYGYGTPAYREVLKAALQAHKDNGLVMDFSMGPQSGQGVPAEPDNPGLAWDLVSYNATILNGIYSGQLPGWGRGDLVSVVTFAVYNATNKTDNPGGTFGSYFQRNYTEYVISEESLTEVTKLVQKDGSIVANVAPVDGAQYYLLYASYAQRSYARACVASSPNPQNILQNGSLAVDHFSETGARVTTKFLEEYILIDGIKELMMEVGNYIWEDSVEIPSYTYWTPALPRLFENEHNYLITKYLPLLAGNEGYISTPGGPVQFITDSSDTDAGVIADFRSTLSAGLSDYLLDLTNWTQQFLGLQFSQQVGYNLPVDMLQLIPDVDAPETETLGFSNRIDGYRQFCGPANLAGKSVISIELGADIIRTYIQTWGDILSEANRAFVAGVNQMSIHGATYSHEYANTTWPGYTSFQYLFSGQHSRHQPAWDVGYKQANDYLARVQFVLQSGAPKVDIVFWDKQTAQNSTIPSLYQSDDLVRKGYTYTYLSPENFEIDAAYVENGVLAPSRQQLKALIIRENDTMTTNGVKHLETYANAGLPIILSGGLPSTYASSDKDAIQSATETMKELLNLENVHQVQADIFSDILETIGINPRTQIDSNGTWYTIWTEFPNSDVHVFIYNEGSYSTGNITFATTGAPYLLNPWTGDQTPVVEYSSNDGKTTIPFALMSNETRIAHFSQSRPSKANFQILQSQKPMLGWVVDESSGEVWAKVTSTDGSKSLTLASGKTIKLSARAELSPSFTLSNWSVTVEQWLPPSDLSNVEIIANKSNVTTTISGSQLSSWSDLNLTTSSGIGYYTSSFTWSSQTNETGAYLVAPPVQQGIVGFLNGKELPGMDIANPNVDVTPFLVDGVNNVTLKTSTTLWDTLLPIWSDLRTGGGAPEFPAEAIGYGHSQNGIIGEVEIVPYQLVKVL